jgi:hypothetical protein
MECLKSGLDIFLKCSVQISVINSHTVTYKPIAPEDNPAQIEFNCSGHSDYYIDCANNFLHSMLSSLSVSLNGKPVTLHETNYHYKAKIQTLLNYGSDAFLIRLGNLKKTLAMPDVQITSATVKL